MMVGFMITALLFAKNAIRAVKIYRYKDHKDNINGVTLIVIDIGYICTIEHVIFLRACLEQFFANGFPLPRPPHPQI